MVHGTYIVIYKENGKSKSNINWKETSKKKGNWRGCESNYPRMSLE